MDLTTQRRLLATIAGGLLLAAAAAVAWSFSSIDSADMAIQAADRSTRPDRVQSMEPPPPSDTVLAKMLRGPLYDPPPVRRTPPPKPAAKPVPVAAPKPTLELTLVGTIIEASESLAILADPSGKFDVKAEGQSLELAPEGVTLEKIEAEQVTLSYQGRRSTVQLDRKVKRKAAGQGKRAKDRRRNR